MSVERIKQNAKSMISIVYSGKGKDEIKKSVLKLSSDIHKLVEEEKKNLEKNG